MASISVLGSFLLYKEEKACEGCSESYEWCGRGALKWGEPLCRGVGYRMMPRPWLVAQALSSGAVRYRRGILVSFGLGCSLEEHAEKKRMRQDEQQLLSSSLQHEQAAGRLPVGWLYRLDSGRLPAKRNRRLKTMLEFMVSAF
jgi:hypothetical protein